MSWRPLRAFSMSIPDEWFPLHGRVLFFNHDGIFQLQGQNELFFWPFKEIEKMAVNPNYWAFQRGEALWFGAIDDEPSPLNIPADCFISYVGAEHSVLYKRGRFYLFSHHEHLMQCLPRGCKYPKLYDGKVYWEAEGCFYRWYNGSVSLIEYTIDKSIDFAVSTTGWVAVEHSDGVVFLRNGVRRFAKNIDDICFDSDGERVLLLKEDLAYVYHLARDERVLLDVGSVDELIGFTPEAMVLGDEESYVFSEEFYEEEPGGYGPEFCLGSCIAYNESTICGLASCLWAIEFDEHGRLEPALLAELPYIDQIWKNKDGFLIESDGMLSFVDNDGEVEEWFEPDAPIRSLTKGGTTIVLENGEEHSLDERFESFQGETTVFGTMVLDGSLANWGWSEEGMWVDMQDES